MAVSSLKNMQDYTFVSKYARYNKEKRRRETWNEAVDRVMNMHLEKYKNFPDVTDDIKWAFDQVRQKRVLGSQRALQFGGSPILKNNSRLYNCTSSYCDRPRFFQECFYLLLCGCGTGLSVQQHHVAKLPEFVEKKNEKKTFVVPDSIEGWADALGVLISSYFGGGDFSDYEGYHVKFDYSKIRPEGSALGSSSGKAPGPEPLRKAIERIKNVFENRINGIKDADGSWKIVAAKEDVLFNNKLRPIDAYDICMHASDAVLSGGVRRSATLVMFSPDDEEMLNAKIGNWFEENPQRGRSNNSAVLIRNKTKFEDFNKIIQSTREFGEPGFIWSDDPEGLFNPSLRAGTLVLTDSGIFPIEELEDKEFKVKNLHGNWERAKCRLSGKNKRLVRIELKTGAEIYATEEHKWPVYNDESLEFEKKETIDIKAGDRFPQGDVEVFGGKKSEDGFISVKAIEITDVYEDVWDISVYDETHCFQIEHCITGNCVEVSLYAYDEETGRSGWEFCNLAEINGKKAKTIEDFKMAAKAAAIIGTLQAGYTDFSYLGEITEKIVRREALLGVSITGVMDSPEIVLNPEVQREMAKYVLEVNKEISKKININPTARATCLKPSGCQVENTLVTTKKGIFKLNELGNINGEEWQNINQEVYTHEGIHKSGKFFINGIAKTKKILLNSGIELEATLNHKYMVLKDGKLNWKEAVDIEEGDILPYSVGEYDGGEYQKTVKDDYKFNEHSHGNHLKFIKQPEIIDENFAWFLGIYFGDGSNHKRGIRIHGDKRYLEDLNKTKEIIMKVFGIESHILEKNKKNNGTELYINSVQLLSFLEKNNLLKNKSKKINIPLSIRKSPKSVIEAFINGYGAADGCGENAYSFSYCTTSKQMAEELVVVLRAIGRDAKLRLMPPTETSKGNSMRYWISERKGRNADWTKVRNRLKQTWKELDEIGLTNYSSDIVISIEESENYTYDIEVDDIHAYHANSYISHNTASLVLATSSGIHPHHATRYFRRMQGNRNEMPLQYFKMHNPLAVEKSVWSANDTDEIITFCVEVPDGLKTKNQMSALDLLGNVRLTQQNWVSAGTVRERCVKPWLHHNVSNTIHVKETEWDDVARYIYDNRKDFAGVSLIPISGDLDYPQAPMCAVHTPQEIVKEYGDGALMASGLIVDCLRIFDDIWDACTYLNIDGKELEKPSKKEKKKYPTEYEFNSAMHIYNERIDWFRRVRQFADRYIGGDVRKTTYLLKEVHNWKLWCDLKRSYVEPDYSYLIEDEDNTKLLEEVACAGGKCELV